MVQEPVQEWCENHRRSASSLERKRRSVPGMHLETRGSEAGFLKHDNAVMITKRRLRDWRDAMLAEGLSAKTISDKHLAAIRAVLRWAFENDRLDNNPMAAVGQDVPRKLRNREQGDHEKEALAVLRASPGYVPGIGSTESAWITAAKRWVPLLCAFTGARVTEMAQLRKEDMR
jgi:integrase